MPLLTTFSYANPVIVEIDGEDRVFTYIPHPDVGLSYIKSLDFNGNVVWTGPACYSGTMAFIGITSVKDVLYIASDRIAVGLNPSDGSTLWSTPTNAQQVCSVGPDDCAYYIGEGDPPDVLAKVDKNGNLLWSRSLGRGGDLGQSAWSFIPVTTDALYVSQINLRWPPYLPPYNVWLMKIDPSDGDELWALDMKALYDENKADVLGLTLDENVVVGGGNNTYCFYPDGTLKWSSSGGAFCSARDTDGTFYLASDASIRSCDPDDGTQTLLYTIPSGSGWIVAIGLDRNKRIYFATSNFVRCIDNNGNLLWSYDVSTLGHYAAGLGLFKDRLFVVLTDALKPSGILCFKTP